MPYGSTSQPALQLVKCFNDINATTGTPTATVQLLLQLQVQLQRQLSGDPQAFMTPATTHPLCSVCSWARPKINLTF